MMSNRCRFPSHVNDTSTSVTTTEPSNCDNHRKRARKTTTTATTTTTIQQQASIDKDDSCVGALTGTRMSSGAHIVSPIPAPRPTKKICSKHSNSEVSTTPNCLIPSPIPSSFICPLTMETMFDPVLDTEGNSYERSAILMWLRQSRTSPLSRQPLTERMLIPNVGLKSAIHETMGDAWVIQQQQQQQQQQHHALLVEDSTSNRPVTSGPSNVNSNNNAVASTADAMSTGVSHNNNFRSKIDCFLQHTCRELGGLQLQLNEDGCCAFRYESITVVLDVPATVGVFCLYTKHLVDLDPLAPKHQNDLLCRRALALNFLQGDTRGGCLSIRSKESGDEIMFSYTDRVPEVSARDFSNILLNFVETSVVLRDKLLKAPQEHATIARRRPATNDGVIIA